jgi:hypothetical protein
VPADPSEPPAPPARPVADLPGEALLAREHELARRWAIALIGARPLADIGEIPLQTIAQEAPSLCGQLIRAVQSDGELHRLTGRGPQTGREASAPVRRLAAIAGASDPAAVVDAVEALRGVLWEALCEQLGQPVGDRSSARLLADACDRLAHVCAAALAVAIDAAGASPPLERADAAADARRSPARAFAASSQPGGDAVIVDELVSEPAQPPPAAIAIRDQRREEGPAAWIGSIGDQLERFQRDELPFAVLLVELADIERLRREALPEELSQLAEQVEQALAATLGELSGSLTRERPGRCWVLAPETDTAGAALLVHHITRAVASGASYRAQPVAVAVGTAVCPRDGREAAALAAHADVGLYAAHAALRAPAGRPAAPVDEPA